MKTSLKNNSGFTLVELLIATVVVSILTASLLPAGKDRRDTARYIATIEKAKLLVEYIERRRRFSYGSTNVNCGNLIEACNVDLRGLPASLALDSWHDIQDYFQEVGINSNFPAPIKTAFEIDASCDNDLEIKVSGYVSYVGFEIPLTEVNYQQGTTTDLGNGCTRIELSYMTRKQKKVRKLNSLSYRKSIGENI